MEPITTALAAVSAASSAISFIKARVNDVQSVSELVGADFHTFLSTEGFE
jgi:hypothetical protein